MPNKAKESRMDAITKEALRDEVNHLRARVAQLEAILVCSECGHLRSEHDGEDGPCFGGRTADMKPGEGAYCDCAGFQTAEG